MTLAIIPARAGSKGIPGKNIMPVCGKPLVAWTIEQALRAGIDRVVVATDGEEIADVAMEYGAEPAGRSAESATDNAPTEVVIAEVLRQYSNRITPDEAVLLLQCTSPIRQSWDIHSVLAVLRNHGSVFSARRVEGYTWWRTKRNVVPHYSERMPRQQHQHGTLEENGSIYAFRASGFLNSKTRLYGNIGVHLMHPLDSFQIDEPDDLALIEQLMHLRMAAICP